jgi:hypothetical protein
MTDKNFVESGPEVIRKALNEVIDVQMVADNVLFASVQILVADLTVDSAMWLLAEFVDSVTRRCADETSVPYDYLAAKFSGYRSACLRYWKKEQAEVPSLEELFRPSPEP